MLWLCLIVTLAFVVGEAFAGFVSNSLALLSDAGHNFSDAFALGLAAYAVWIARKPSNAGKTYGYHRASILTALFNAATLLVIAVVIVIEAVSIFRHPQPVHGELMMWVAAVSVLMNTVIAALLRGGASHSLNVRAAYIHMAGDALSAVGVLAAGWVVKSTGWTYADPAVSVLIAGFIAWSSIGVARDATNVLLEGSPKGSERADHGRVRSRDSRRERGPIPSLRHRPRHHPGGECRRVRRGVPPRSSALRRHPRA